MARSRHLVENGYKYPNLNRYNRYQEFPRNLNPYPQPFQPQIQPPVIGFNPGLGCLAASINNFGPNIPQIPDLTRYSQGNPNPLQQPPNPQAQPLVRRIQGGGPFHPSSAGPATQNDQNDRNNQNRAGAGRIDWTRKQLEVLNREFKENKKPSKLRKEIIAIQLDVPKDKVSNWFKNTRQHGYSKNNKQ